MVFHHIVSTKNEGPDSHIHKRAGIQRDHAEGDIFDYWSVKDLFVMAICSTSLGVEYFRFFHTNTYRKWSLTEEVLI